VVVALVATLALVVPSSAGPAPAGRGSDVLARDVVFEVENANTTPVACRPDNRSYRLRGRLVGPRSEVAGADADRINVLVHDTTTGAWFWHLRRHPAYDYATQLARRGETSLVLDRLGYDRSPLRDGRATCLGAHADMLHQVVQHLRSGAYRFTGTDDGTPAAQHVVVHGHSLGASIAQVEAATFDDVDGLVLMSWADSGPSREAVEAASRQSATCLQGREYAPFTTSRAAFRRGLFVTAPPRVQATASRLRNSDPCGDVLSYSSNLLTSGLTASRVEAPVLLLFGTRDAYTSEGAARRQAASFSSARSVRTRLVRGAGNALPLERSAPQTRALVGRWLRATAG
jgi:pimeloyl-ACP methyl ester carboxylesterase